MSGCSSRRWAFGPGACFGGVRARTQVEMRKICNGVANAAFSVTARVVGRFDVRPAPVPAYGRCARLPVGPVPGKAAAACLGLGRDLGLQGPSQGCRRGAPRFRQRGISGSVAGGMRSSGEEGPSGLRRWRGARSFGDGSGGKRPRGGPVSRHGGHASSSSPRMLG